MSKFRLSLKLKAKQLWLIGLVGVLFGGVMVVGTVSVTQAASTAPYWDKSGTSVFYNDGNVGIGTNTPGGKLDVNTGALTFSNGGYIDMNRDGGINKNGISWYSLTYPSWSTYMAPPGVGMGPHGDLTAPSGSFVTSWGLRSYIENLPGYGWTFESAANTTTPAVKFEINSSDGLFHSFGSGIIDGNLGVGTSTPQAKLEVDGNIVMNANTNPVIFIGVGGSDNGRYLQVLNTPQVQVASGLKTGGLLVADYYPYANPGKNDLIVKGNVGIGTATPQSRLEVNGDLTFDSGTNPIIFTGTGGADNGRYLQVLNTPQVQVASGLKTGGLLVADYYPYANPGKNDLIVKGNVGIGTTNLGAYKLAVNGTIHAKEIIVDSNWADFVFDKKYARMPLSDLANYVAQNSHLPGMPTADEVKQNGANLGDTQVKLLQKVEELSLYAIDQQNQIDQLKNEIEAGGIK